MSFKKIPAPGVRFQNYSSFCHELSRVMYDKGTFHIDEEGRLIRELNGESRIIGPHAFCSEIEEFIDLVDGNGDMKLMTHDLAEIVLASWTFIEGIKGVRDVAECFDSVNELTDYLNN